MLGGQCKGKLGTRKREPAVAGADGRAWGCFRVGVPEEWSRDCRERRRCVGLNFAAHSLNSTCTCGAVAQLGEHRLCKPRVEGSNPFRSTTPLPFASWRETFAPSRRCAVGLCRKRWILGAGLSKCHSRTHSRANARADTAPTGDDHERHEPGLLHPTDSPSLRVPDRPCGDRRAGCRGWGG